eukprot:scaffold14097_cov107-Isochrysis_galbana.AAC.4
MAEGECRERFVFEERTAVELRKGAPVRPLVRPGAPLRRACGAAVVGPCTPPLHTKGSLPPHRGAEPRGVQKRVALQDGRVGFARLRLRRLPLPLGCLCRPLLLDALKLTHQLLGLVLVIALVVAFGRGGGRNVSIVRILGVDDQANARLVLLVLLRRGQRRRRPSDRRLADRLQVIQLALLKLSAQVPGADLHLCSLARHPVRSVGKE